MAVLLRGVAAALLAGAGCGLTAGLLLVIVTLADGSPAGAFVALGLAGYFGAIVGAVVGVPAAIVLALVQPAVPEPRYAALTGLGVAAAAGFVVAMVVAGEVWLGVVFGGVCAIVGSVVGRWVLFGNGTAAG